MTLLNGKNAWQKKIKQGNFNFAFYVTKAMRGWREHVAAILQIESWKPSSIFAPIKD